MAGHWRTVNDAAHELETSADAIRKRIQRGTLPSKRQDGRVMVWLDREYNAINPESTELVEVLRDEIAHLRRESERKDHLLAAALERIPAIEPSETPGSPETPGSSPEGVEVPDRGTGPETAPQHRSWWRRWFGG